MLNNGDYTFNDDDDYDDDDYDGDDNDESGGSVPVRSVRDKYLILVPGTGPL